MRYLDASRGRTVARLHAALAGHYTIERELGRGGMATVYLAHPHILPLYDSGEPDGFLYYVMPFVEGESPRDRLAPDKQLPLHDAMQVARKVADALC